MSVKAIILVRMRIAAQALFVGVCVSIVRVFMDDTENPQVDAMNVACSYPVLCTE